MAMCASLPNYLLAQVLLLCSLIERVILAPEIGKARSQGNHQWCVYGSMTRGQMVTR
jgi:hypothetical protein